MCKYCEKQNIGDGKEMREALPTRPNDNTVEVTAGIVPPTPISRRRYGETGMTSEIQVGVFLDNDESIIFSMPIKYCPMCGKKLDE